MTIKAIIFDFGNVICTFDNTLFVRKMTKYTKKSYEELWMLIYHQSSLPKQYESGLITSDQFFEEMVRLCELDVSKEAFIEAYTNIFTPIESTFELIKKLKNKYRLALLSNTSEWDFAHGIAMQEIFPCLRVHTLSYIVKAMKPKEGIFLDSLLQLGLQPEECIFIDDIKEYVDVANKMGINGIHYIGAEDLKQKLRELGVEF